MPGGDQLLRLAGVSVGAVRGSVAPLRIQLDDERHFGQPEVYFAASTSRKGDDLVKLYYEPGSGRQERSDLKLQPRTTASPALRASASNGASHYPRRPQVPAVALPFAEVAASRTETIRAATRHFDVAAELARDVGP